MGVANVADPAALRERMIATLRERGVLRDARIERAFAAIQREAFLPGVPLERVYSGDAIPTHHDAAGSPISSSSEVAVMICMIEMLNIASGQRVLEIGTGTGYNAAVLASLVGKRGEVTSVELDGEFAAEARAHFEGAGIDCVSVVVGDGWFGHAGHAPYDGIVVTASPPRISSHWVDQLADAGRLVMPVRAPCGPQLLVAFRRDHGALESTSLRAGGFMPLRSPAMPDESWVAAGGFEFGPSQLAGPLRSQLESLLKEKPKIEIGPALRWESLSLMALAEPSIIGIRRARMPGAAIGVLITEPPGLAIVEHTGSLVAGPFTHLISYGSALASQRLRELLDVYSAARLGQFRLLARRRDDDSYDFEVVRGEAA